MFYICFSMNRPRLQILMMLLTILGVVGFQAFWLKQTYEQEKKSLALKTDFAFRETIRTLQASKLDSAKGLPGEGRKGKKIIVSSLPGVTNIIATDTTFSSERIASVRVVKSKDADPGSNHIFNNEITLAHRDKGDTLKKVTLDTGFFEKNGPRGEHITLIFDRIDSLQASITSAEISKVLAEKMRRQNTAIPFTVEGPVEVPEKTEPALNEVMVGFVKPSMYKLNTGNEFFFLLNRIRLPILFSLLLTAITVLSFFFIYRNLQKQRRLTEMKNEFIGNITHELKTPIATVSVALEALNDFDGLKDPARTKEYLGIAGGELNRLSMMVDKVLRLSMFENKSVALQYERFDLVLLIREVMLSMQPQLEKANAETTFKLTGSDFNISADKMHISSVLYNLLDNAVKYSKDHPQIDIAATEEEKNITVRIKDNGIGIDPAYREKIFEKFFRVPHGNMHNVKGYGLGLSYAAHIIQEHGGSIRAESDGTNGTTFIIQLPKHAG